MRKIAANYIVLPGFEWVKNGYVEFESSQKMKVVDTGGRIRDLAGLEFYGGVLVPEYVWENKKEFREGMLLQPLLNQIFVSFA